MDVYQNPNAQVSKKKIPMHSIANRTISVSLVAAIYMFGTDTYDTFLDQFKLAYNQNTFCITCRVNAKTFSGLQTSLIAVFKERRRDFSW